MTRDNIESIVIILVGLFLIIFSIINKIIVPGVIGGILIGFPLGEIYFRYLKKRGINET